MRVGFIKETSGNSDPSDPFDVKHNPNRPVHQYIGQNCLYFLFHFNMNILIFQLHLPELALSYCDRMYEAGLNQQYGKAQGNIYLTLLQIYLNPRRTTKNIEKKITNLVSSPSNSNLVSSPSNSNLKTGWSSLKAKGRGFSKKIAEIEGAEDTKIKASSSDGGGRSDFDSDDLNEEGSSMIMLDEVLDVLTQRWDRVHGAKTLRLLPKETKLKVTPMLSLYNFVHF